MDLLQLSLVSSCSSGYNSSLIRKRKKIRKEVPVLVFDDENPWTLVLDCLHRFLSRCFCVNLYQPQLKDQSSNHPNRGLVRQEYLTELMELTEKRVYQEIISQRTTALQPFARQTRNLCKALTSPEVIQGQTVSSDIKQSIRRDRFPQKTCRLDPILE